MDNKEKLRQWLLAMLQGIVEYPDDVSVNVKSDEMGVLYVVQVAATDRGMCIGREGSTSKAIRTLMNIAGLPKDIRASVKFDFPPAPGKSV